MKLNKNIIIIPATLSEMTDEINIISFNDSVLEKKVTAVIELFNSKINFTKEIVLWECVEYDNIGQWTDIDAQNRIKIILEQ